MIFITDAMCRIPAEIRAAFVAWKRVGQGPARHAGHRERAGRPRRRSATRSTSSRSLDAEEPPSAASCPCDRDSAPITTPCTTRRNPGRMATTAMSTPEDQRPAVRRRRRRRAARRDHHLDLLRRARSATPTWSTPCATAGLDPKVARDWPPATPSPGRAGSWPRRGSSARSPRTRTPIRFQFTSRAQGGRPVRVRAGDACSPCDKADGAVDCDLPGLATLAQEELDEAMGVRTAGDVTAVIQRLFDRQADLFPIREQGGCYFVPAAARRVRRPGPGVRRPAQRPARRGSRSPRGRSAGDESVRVASPRAWRR